MTAQQLKNAILQEAIEGRLVPQDPNDEPANALLQRIRQEKARLVKEGKLKKKDLEEKPISEDEIPFEIPESWEWVRLGWIGITETGTTPSKSFPEYFGNHIAFLGPANILNGVIVCVTQGLSEIGMQYGRVVPANTILQVCIGGSIGKSAITDKAVTFNQQLNSITPIDCSVKFVHFVLQSRYFFLSLIDKSTGTATPIINRSNWEQLLVPLPPLAEQHRIVAKIEELLPKVEEYGKAQEKLNKLNEELPERLKKSILQEAIEGRLVPQDPNDEPASALLNRIREEKKQLVKVGKLKKKDLEERPISEDEIPFEIPDTWEWVRYGAIFNVRSAKRIHQTDWQSSGVPFFRGRELVQLIKTGDVNSEIFIKEELYESLKEYGIPAKDDILISAVGTIGRVYIVKGIKPFYYKDAYILCCENIGKINPQFIAFALTSPYLQKLIHQDSMATTVAQLTIEKAKSLVIPFPPLAEQHRIVAKIEELFQTIDNLKVK